MAENPEKKIVLPSSGLAEEILGGTSVEFGGEAAEEAIPESPGTAKGKPDAETEEILHLVTFFLNSEEYALEIFKVQEIIRVNGWTRVPNAPDYIKGVINLRGKIIPVIDPKLKMSLKGSELTKDSRVMVIEAGGRLLGMLVDGVHQVLKLPSGVVEPPPEEAGGVDGNFIKGVGKLDGRLIILIDIEKAAGKEAKAVQAVAVAAGP